MTTWVDEILPGAGINVVLIKDDLTPLVKDDGSTLLVKDSFGGTIWTDETYATTKHWIDLTDNLQMRAILSGTRSPLGQGVTDTESGMERILLTGDDDSTIWSDE